MRSPVQAPCSLPALASLVDQATLDLSGHVLVHVDGPLTGDLALGVKRLPPGVHPFDALAGWSAPDSWAAFGIRVSGRARHLDRPDAPARPMTTTFVVDRAGAEASVLRTTDGPQDLPGPAEGTVPDLCRRVLGVATAPAPPTTALLWTLQWLDRLLDAWGQPQRRRDLLAGWPHLAVLHPAVADPTEHHLNLLADPAALVEQARAHALARPWSMVRRSADPLPLPDGPLDPAIARWMDDGFFARWVLGGHPSPIDTLHTLCPMLGAPLGDRLRATVLALLA